jgi:hypothetical protein
MKSKAQLIQENLLAELEKVSEIEFFKKAGKAVSGVATGLDKLSNLGKKIQDYDPSKPSKKTKDEWGDIGVQRNISDTGKAIDDLQAINRLTPADRQDAIIKKQSPEKQIISRKSQLMRKQRMTPDKLEKARQEKAEKAAIAKSISRNRKKAPASGIGAGIAKATPVPGQQVKPTRPTPAKSSKLPAIGGILPTDPRYPALAAKVAAAEKNK